MTGLTNYHSHTQFCDAKNTIEEFVVAAIEAGFTDWGVSPHCPLPMLPRAGWVMQEGDVEGYFREVDRLRAEYGDRIRIHRGMEVDWVDEGFNPSVGYFQDMGLDYIIGSVHLLRSPQTGEMVDIDCGVEWFERTVRNHFGGSLQKLVEEYYRAMTYMVEAGGFNFVGHPDKVSANARLLSRGVMQKDWYRGLVSGFLELCASKGVVLEINTKAFPHTGVFYPDAMWWERMAELGIRVIINSDTHRINALSVGLCEARRGHKGYKGEIITKI